MKTALARAATLAVLPLWTLSGCAEDQDGVIRREGEPDYVTAFDEQRMEAAISEARSTLPTFIEALESRDEDRDAFAIKKGFPYGEDGEEFIWITDVRRSGDGFVGRVNNEPVNAVGVELGETVHVARDELADWMFMLHGKLQGGYTIVALAYGTPEQAEYEESMGIDWSAYEFLRGKEMAIEQGVAPAEAR
jgi:uncharacterized protein YegJ (DUF2314 family)